MINHPLWWTLLLLWRLNWSGAIKFFINFFFMCSTFRQDESKRRLKNVSLIYCHCFFFFPESSWAFAHMVAKLVERASLREAGSCKYWWTLATDTFFLISSSFQSAVSKGAICNNKCVLPLDAVVVHCIFTQNKPAQVCLLKGLRSPHPPFPLPSSRRL